jgi:hypothetical protein
VTSPDERYAGGCYDWSRHDVPALAGFLDEDLAPGWAQVTSWWHAHDLTTEHLSVMRQAREAVVAAWPPSVNQAAAAYVDQLDALIASMDNMRVAAEANARALSGILTVLTDAKNRVDELHAQWDRQPSSWETTALTVASVLTADARTSADVQALAIYRASLNTQAQALMRATDQSVYEYLPQLVVPAGRVTPSIADVNPVPSGDSPSNGSDRSSSGVGSVRRPVIPAAALPIADGGPVLSGGKAANLTVDSGSGGPAQVASPGSHGPGPMVSIGEGLASPWIQTAVGRVLRSGAVLGAPPEAFEPDGLAARSQAVTRDGVSAARAGEPETGIWGPGGVGVGRSPNRTLRRTMPPDTEWPVPRGVSPVLEPGPEPVHDPGPGVIGIDR